MDDVGGVHEEESAQDLVDEVLHVVFSEFLPRVDHAVQVGLHQLRDDVDVGVAGARLGLQDVHQADDVVVFEELCVGRGVLSSLISRTMRLASMRSSKALMTCVGEDLPS